MALSSGWLHDIFAGSVSGGVAVLVSHPFDTIRVRQQTIQTGWRARGLRGTTSALTCVRELSKTEGLTGFYRGIASPLVATPVQFATTFFGFGLIKRHLEGLELSNHAVSALAGGGAGAVQCLVVTPFDVIKIRYVRRLLCYCSFITKNSKEICASDSISLCPCREIECKHALRG